MRITTITTTTLVLSLSPLWLGAIEPMPTFSASNSWNAYTPDKAFDGNCFKEPVGWNAGSHPPQHIEINFGELKSIVAMAGFVGQSPNGNTEHEVYFNGVLMFKWVGFTRQLQLLNHDFTVPIAAQVVRVSTTVSPSWVAWREIQFEFASGERFPETGAYDCEDIDTDGLTTEAEHNDFGTNPLDPDTDDDGLLDGVEVDLAQGSGCPNPLNPDSDGDLVHDGAEVDSGTDPCVPASAKEQLGALIVMVLGLNLQSGISNSFDSKLSAALQALDDVNQNNDVAAINALQAFINAVEAQRGIWIPTADGNALIAIAQNIIDQLTT